MKLLNFPTTTRDKFFVFDVEYLADRRLYERYRRSDPRPAPCRWPFRRVVAATVMAVSIENGAWVVEDFRSFVGADERQLLRAFFGWVIERPDYIAVSWSGAAEDLPILKTSSMEYGLVIPRQLRQNERDRAGFLHDDLCLTLKGGSGSHVHQMELATRLQLPAKMAGSAGQVPYRVAQNDFATPGFISECDVLTTALLLASHLVTIGEVRSLKAAHFVTMSFARAHARRTGATYDRELGNYVAKAQREMVAEQHAWLEAC